MKNIHLLPTENYKQDYTLQSGEVVKVVRLGQLIINKEYNELSVNKNPQWSASCDTDVLVPHHIYITSDEEIKEGDWMIRGNEQPTLVTHDFFWDFGDRYHKIILTTDQDLIKDGVQAIDDEFLEWFVKNPSCEEVEVKKVDFEVDMGLGDECIEHGSYYKIILPQGKLTYSESAKKEERIFNSTITKQETLEEAAYNWVRQPVIGTRRESFIEGAKWQAERMYSEEELREAFKQGHSSARKGSYNQITEQEDFDKWFEQFKKSNL